MTIVRVSTAKVAPVIAAAPSAELDARVRRAMREARTEAVIVLAIDVALFGALAFVDKLNGWGILDLPWWAWLLLAAPAVLLMLSLLAVPRAELSPGRVRDVGLALLGLIVAPSRASASAPCHYIVACRALVTRPSERRARPRGQPPLRGPHHGADGIRWPSPGWWSAADVRMERKGRPMGAKENLGLIEELQQAAVIGTSTGMARC